MNAFKPPLSKADLAAICARNPPQPGNPASADLYAVLWEIKRLRALVLRADQLQRSLGEPGGGVGLILGVLRRELANEPCIAEQPVIDELSGRVSGHKGRDEGA